MNAVPSLDELLVDKKIIEEQILHITDSKKISITNIRRFVDDSLPCAHVILNEVPMEFNWYECLGFLSYYKDSPSAFDDLMRAIRHNVIDNIKEMINDKVDQQTIKD